MPHHIREVTSKIAKRVRPASHSSTQQISSVAFVGLSKECPLGAKSHDTVFEGVRLIEHVYHSLQVRVPAPGHRSRRAYGPTRTPSPPACQPWQRPGTTVPGLLMGVSASFRLSR